MVAEGRPDDLPDGHQVRALRGGDVHRGAGDVAQPAPGGGQRLAQVGDGAFGLDPQVAGRDHGPVVAQRAGAGREHQTGRGGDHGGVGVGHVVGERPSSREGTARWRTVVDVVPHTTACRPNSTMIAPASHGDRVSASPRWVSVSITRPMRMRVARLKRSSSRRYVAEPSSPPAALAVISRP